MKKYSEFCEGLTVDEIAEKLYDEDFFKGFLEHYTHESKKDIERDFGNCNFYANSKAGFAKYRAELIEGGEDDEELIAYGWSQLDNIHDLIRFDWYV